MGMASVAKCLQIMQRVRSVQVERQDMIDFIGGRKHFVTVITRPLLTMGDKSLCRL